MSVTIANVGCQQAADHLVPPRRDPDRNLELQAALHNLWQRDTITVQRCEGCGFGFADPFVAGTAEVYNLIGGGHQYYPGARFEFGATIETLRASAEPRRALEVGAGAGAFLEQAFEEGVLSTAAALEYDDSAISRLQRLPRTTVLKADVQQVAATGCIDPVDVICLFQVLEHLDRLDEVFAALVSLLRPAGEIFVAVPHAARLTVQEDLTGFMDMPPIHIGRWTPEAMESIAHRHGLIVVEHRTSNGSALSEVWGLAKYRLEARTRRRGSLSSHVESLSWRPARGALKRSMALWDLALLAPRIRRIPPEVSWFHLRSTSTGLGHTAQLP